MKFSPDGQSLVSGSFDKSIFLWRVYGECPNYAMLTGHKGAVLEVHWCSGGKEVLSASADKSAALWDAESGTMKRRFREAKEIVNTACPSTELWTISRSMMVVAGSDDGTATLWDSHRARRAASVLRVGFPVTAVSIGCDQVFTAGIGNDVMVWDGRSLKQPLLRLAGHRDMVTGISLSRDGQSLLSASADNTMRIFDVRPFCSGDRAVKYFPMIPAPNIPIRNLVKPGWSADGRLVGVGGPANFVCVYDVFSQQMKFQLPGHKGCVNEVAFHPSEPIVGSCASDREIFLGELLEA